MCWEGGQRPGHIESRRPRSEVAFLKSAGKPGVHSCTCASVQAAGGRGNQDSMCIWKGPRGSSRESRADAGRLEEGAPLGPRLGLPAICARVRYRDWRELDGFDSILEVTARFGDGLVMALGKSEGERMTFTPAPQLGKWKPSPSQPGGAGSGQG